MPGLKIAGLLCSFADIFACAAFLAVMDCIRRRPHSKVRYGILLIFTLLTPVLLITPLSSTRFFIMQFLVLAPPYLILVYTAVTEARHFVAHVRAKLNGDV